MEDPLNTEEMLGQNSGLPEISEQVDYAKLSQEIPKILNSEFRLNGRFLKFKMGMITELTESQKANLVENYDQIQDLESLGLSDKQIDAISELSQSSVSQYDTSKEIIQKKIRAFLSVFNKIQESELQEYQQKL